MLLVGVLSLYFILKVEFKLLILLLDLLDLALERGHVPLLPVQLDVHLVESLLLLFLNSLHCGVNIGLPFIQLLILFLQVLESVLQRINRVLLTIVYILIVLNDLLEELRVLVEVAELPLPLLKLHLLLVDAPPELLDCLLVVQGSCI